MADIRALYESHPEYEAQGWTLEEFAQSLYQKHYAKDRTWDEFAAESGLGQGGGIGGQEMPPAQGEPGTGMAGFGYDNPEIAAEMGQKDWKPWLDEVSNALMGKVASGATFGVAPAIARRATDGESDKDLQRGTDILGKNASFLLEGAAGIPTAVATAPFMPSALMKFGTETFNPGVLSAGKRILGNAIDAVGIDTGNKLIGGEEVSPSGIWDTVQAAGTWGVALESLLGIKRAASKGVAQWGQTPDQKALDDAINAVQNMIKTKGAKGKTGQETVLDMLEGSGVKTAQSLREVAPEEFSNVQDAAATRMGEQPVRVRSKAEQLSGTSPLEEPKVQSQKYLEDLVYQENQKFIPLFEKTPKIKKESIWVNTSPKKTRATVPAGMGKILQDPEVYAAWEAATDKGRQNAKSYATRDKRAAPGELENTWHAVLDLENSPDTALANYGKTFKEILRGNNKSLNDIVATEAKGHQQARAAEIGGKAHKQPSLLTTEARNLTSPENRDALAKGYWGELVRRAEAGDALPRNSVLTRKTTEKVAGPAKAADFDEFLRQEHAKLKTDKPLAEDKGSALPGAEVKTPKGPLARTASGMARVAIGGLLGGPAGAVWGLPTLLRLGINPNRLTDPKQGASILRLLMEDINNQSKPRPKNVGERTLNTGALLPAISADTQDTQQERRKQRRKGYENSKEYLESKD